MGRRKGEEEPKEWTEANENAFLRILHERVSNDPDSSKPNFDWAQMDEELFLEVGERYGVEKLRGKFNRLRIKYRQFTELINQNGVTYDPSSNTVVASDSLWQFYSQKHKNFNVFKKQGCKNYGLLDLVFNKLAFVERQPRRSSWSPPNPCEAPQIEEGFIDRGAYVIECEKSGIGSSKGKRPVDEYNTDANPANKDPRLENFDLCLEKWASSLSVKFELYLARAEKCKKVSNEATINPSDSYSIEECMDALESVDDVSDASYNKALEKFKDLDWRKMFIKMPINRKKAWLNSLA